MTQCFDHGQKEYGWDTIQQTGANNYILPNMLKLLPKEKKLTILDAGCGNGYNVGKLVSFGFVVTGIDISEDGILLARKVYPEGKFEIRSVYDDLSYLETNFDIVISSDVIEHLYFPNKFMQNMNSVLKPGGFLILSTPYHGWLKNTLISITGQWDKHHTANWEGGHIKFFSEDSLTELLSVNGFGNIKFMNAGRVPYLWKSMICKAQKIY